MRGVKTQVPLLEMKSKRNFSKKHTGKEHMSNPPCHVAMVTCPLEEATKCIRRGCYMGSSIRSKPENVNWKKYSRCMKLSRNARKKILRK
jgi:hypothetical protein